MLCFEVSVPEFGETTTLPGGKTIVADGKQVSVTIGGDEGPDVAFLLGAEEAAALASGIFGAARFADPRLGSFRSLLRLVRGAN